MSVQADAPAVAAATRRTPRRSPVVEEPHGLVRRIDATPPAEWDRDAARFDDVSYDQTATYADTRWSMGRTSSLALVRDGVLLGMARGVRLRAPCLPVGVTYVKFGPLWRRSRGSADLQAYRALLDALIDEHCRRRGDLLTIMPRPDPDFAALEAEALHDMGFRTRRPMRDPIRYFVDLRLDAETQRASLGQKWRYNLRKAEAENLTIAVETGPDAIRTFCGLHGEMLERKRFRAQEAVHLLGGLAASAPHTLRPGIVLARKAGRAVAGAVVEHGGSVATYVFGASGAAALELRAGYALQWWIARWLSGQGKLWYDLGGGASEPHLEQFKRGFVGKSGALLELPGEFDFWTRGTGRFAGDLVYRARDLQRRLRAAGRFRIGAAKG